MDTGTVAVALGLSGLIAAGVAIVKGLWPGDMPPRMTVATVAVLSALLVGLAYASGELHGNAFQAVAQWLLQGAAAIGVREAVVVAAPKAADLPSRS